VLVFYDRRSAPMFWIILVVYHVLKANHNFIPLDAQ